MKRTTLLAVLSALGVFAACDNSKRALLQADVSLAPEVQGRVASVELDVSTATATIASGTLPWSTPDAGTAGALPIGVYVSVSNATAVTVVAHGFASDHLEIGRSAPATVTLVPGQASTPVPLVIAAGNLNGDGGIGNLDGAVANPDGGTTGNGDTSGPALGAPENLEDDLSASSSLPEVAVNPTTGDAIVIWSESRAVKTRRYSVASGQWSPVKIVDNRGEPQSAVIGMDAAGHAVAAWVLLPNANAPDEDGIWASRSDDGLVWAPPFQIAKTESYVGTSLAVSRNGKGRLVWEGRVNMKTSLWTAFFDGVTWTSPMQVMPTEDDDNRYGKVAIDALGNGVIVWSQPEVGAGTFEESIWSAGFYLDSVKTPVLVESNKDRNFTPRVAMNPDGHGLIVWEHSTTDTDKVESREYLTSSGLLVQATVATAYAVSEPDAAVDTKGNLTVVWAQTESSVNSNVHVSQRPMGGIWSTPTPLEKDDHAETDSSQNPAPRLGVDAAGNLVAIWRKRESEADNFTYGVWSAEQTFGQPWTAATKLAGMPNLKALWPDFALADNGRGVVGFVYAKDDMAVVVNPPTWEVFTIVRR